MRHVTRLLTAPVPGLGRAVGRAVVPVSGHGVFGDAVPAAELVDPVGGGLIGGTLTRAGAVPDHDGPFGDVDGDVVQGAGDDAGLGEVSRAGQEDDGGVHRPAWKA